MYLISQRDNTLPFPTKSQTIRQDLTISRGKGCEQMRSIPLTPDFDVLSSEFARSSRYTHCTYLLGMRPVDFLLITSVGQKPRWTDFGTIFLQTQPQKNVCIDASYTVPLSDHVPTCSVSLAFFLIMARKFHKLPRSGEIAAGTWIMIIIYICAE